MPLSAARVLGVALAAWRAPRLEWNRTSRLDLRVLPADLDVFGHVTNARYLSLMNLGRGDYVVRTGLGRAAFGLRAPLIAGEIHIRYLQPLSLAQRFTLETRVSEWDRKWFHFEHRFVTARGLAASGTVRALFRGRAGNIPVPDMLAAAGQPVDDATLERVPLS